MTESKSSRHLDHKQAQERRNPNIFAAAVSLTLTLEIKHFTVLSPLSDNVRVVFDASELRYSRPPDPTGVSPCSYHHRILVQAPKHHPYPRFRPRSHRAICLLHVWRDDIWWWVCELTRSREAVVARVTGFTMAKHPYGDPKPAASLPWSAHRGF